MLYKLTKIISISLTDDEKNLLDDMDLSPTGLFKQKLLDVKQNSKNYQDKMRVLGDSLQHKQIVIARLLEFIKSRNLEADYGAFLEQKT